MTADEKKMLEVADLEAYYGPSHILSDICLHTGRGEVVALLGRNGAGKSTTLKTIMGLVPPAAGRVRFQGEDLAGQPPYAICRRGIGFVPQERRIFPDLTVGENLEVGRRPPRTGGSAWTAERVFDLFPALRPLEQRRGGSLSGGEQQMLTIARTLMGQPALLLLDEPSEGLAPRLVQAMTEQLLQLKREGTSILMSEQNLHFAAQISDRAYILEKGRIQYQGSMTDLRADKEVRRRFLMV